MDSTRNYTIGDQSGTRRVVIYELDSGGFTFEEEHFGNDPLEQCWLPVTKGRSHPICASLEIALREAAGRVSWLAAEIGHSHDQFDTVARYVLEKNAELYRRLASH
jgi:hypothetical protein